MKSQSKTVAVAEPDPDWRPSHNQRAMLDVAMRSGVGRTNASMCREVGISQQTLYAWLKQPGFAALWAEAPLKIVRTHLPNATAALMHKAITEADVPAIKLAMHAAGVIQPAGVSVHIGDKVNQQLNVGHLALVQRADNAEQFEIIKNAVRQATAEAKVVDVEVVKGGDAAA